MNTQEIAELMEQLIHKTEVEKIVIGTSRLGKLNRLGMLMTGKKDAHSYVKTYPEEESKIIHNYFKLKKSRPIFGLCDVAVYTRK